MPTDNATLPGLLPSGARGGPWTVFFCEDCSRPPGKAPREKTGTQPSSIIGRQSSSSTFAISQARGVMADLASCRQSPTVHANCDTCGQRPESCTSQRTAAAVATAGLLPVCKGRQTKRPE